MSKEDQESADRSELDAREMSVMRTLMGANRTLMAWTRTSFSMLTFGFTLYKILDALQATNEDVSNPNMPRNAGLVLIVMALLALLLGSIDYLRTFRQLEQLVGEKLQKAPSLITAAFTALIGVFLLVVIINRAL